MNHAQLRAFHAVAAEGGFTRAAAALHVTQPTLSGQVAALEAAYGVKLFERRGRSVEPTELGRRLFEVTRRLFGQEAEAEALLAGARGLASGELRVGADAPYQVVPLVATFHRRHPGIRLAMTFGNSARVLQDLMARRCDVAVLAELPADERLHSLAIRRDRLIALVARDHPWSARRSLRLAELAGHRLILREPGSITRKTFEAGIARAGIAPAETLEIGSREAVREAVAAGLGIGVIFESEFGNDARLHRLAFREPALEATEYAACLAERRSSRVVRAFFELLQDGVAAV